ncbi:DUF4333 domain-containing protein [Nesterenkonia ebinurensis]|uniref:DUF4333 domain-containing protein n=1 Tax=Nesterenkonia ebinurensis TaxID=2608252 RepID=UPI00123CCA2B|nr:DUF4333 domain-containing protein [Nesterenkonia ebinurensis]
MPRMKHALTALVAAGAIGLTAACGNTWAESDIESDVERDLDSQFPEDAPHEVDCDGDLDAEVGETISCPMSDQNGSGTAEIEIVSVDGNEIEYEVNIPDYSLDNGDDDLDIDDGLEDEDADDEDED